MPKDKSVLLVIYGDGGHRTEMARLLTYLAQHTQSLNLVSMGNGSLPHSVLAHFPTADIRHKYNRWLNLLFTIPIMLKQLFTTVSIIRRYSVVGVLSTGPGLCIVPMAVCRVMGIKTVFIETFCRFNSRSMTGRMMYRMAHRFLVQNKSLQALYPNSEYCGRL